ncbi:MAG: hypothetical protein Q9194_007000 [Teloschistes cf. exilis]
MPPTDRESFRENFVFPPADDWGYPVTDPNLNIDDRGYPIYPAGYVPPHLAQTTRPPITAPITAPTTAPITANITAAVQGSAAEQIKRRRQGTQTNPGNRSRHGQGGNDNIPQVYRITMNRLEWPDPTQALSGRDRVPAELVQQGGSNSSIIHGPLRLIRYIARRYQGMTIFVWSDPSENEMPTTLIEGISWYQGYRGEWIAFDSRSGHVRLDIEARRPHDPLRRQAIGAPDRGAIPEPIVMGFPATNPPFQTFNTFGVVPRDRDPRIQWHRLGNYFRAWRPAEMMYDDRVQPNLDTALVSVLERHHAAWAARIAPGAAATQATPRAPNAGSRNVIPTIDLTLTAATDTQHNPDPHGTSQPGSTKTGVVASSISAPPASSQAQTPSGNTPAEPSRSQDQHLRRAQAPPPPDLQPAMRTENPRGSTRRARSLSLGDVNPENELLMPVGEWQMRQRRQEARHRIARRIPDPEQRRLAMRISEADRKEVEANRTLDIQRQQHMEERRRRMLETPTEVEKVPRRPDEARKRRRSHSPE